MTYKVVFSVATAAKKPDEVNPTLEAMARYVNTLAKNGVAADHRRIAAVFHQDQSCCVRSDTKLDGLTPGFSRGGS